MTEPTPIPETHVFDGDVIALTEWAQATLDHYEKPPGGLAVLYDGKDAGIVFSDWQSEKDPLAAFATHAKPEVYATGPIADGDTVTFDEHRMFGTIPGPLKQDQLALPGLTPKWDAGYDRPDGLESLAQEPQRGRFSWPRRDLRSVVESGEVAASTELIGWEDNTIPAADFDYELEASMARHPAGRATRLAAATQGDHLASVHQLRQN